VAIIQSHYVTTGCHLGIATDNEIVAADDIQRGEITSIDFQASKIHAFEDFFEADGFIESDGGLDGACGSSGTDESDVQPVLWRFRELDSARHILFAADQTFPFEGFQMAHDSVGGADFKVLPNFAYSRAVAAIDNLVAEKFIDFSLAFCE